MMPSVVSALLVFLGSLFQSRRSLALQVLALQHQVVVANRPFLAPLSSACVIAEGDHTPRRPK
jgi:hypothetical protein